MIYTPPCYLVLTVKKACVSCVFVFWRVFGLKPFHDDTIGPRHHHHHHHPPHHVTAHQNQPKSVLLLSSFDVRLPLIIERSEIYGWRMWSHNNYYCLCAFLSQKQTKMSQMNRGDKSEASETHLLSLLDRKNKQQEHKPNGSSSGAEDGVLSSSNTAPPFQRARISYQPAVFYTHGQLGF